MRERREPHNKKGGKQMENQKMPTKIAVRLLCLALALVLISCIGASAIQTNFGKTEVYDFLLPCDDGMFVSAMIYRPLSATAETPAPLVVVSHGGANHKEMQDMNAVELSRRGMVVISVDRYYHGESSAATVGFNDTMSSAVTAMVAAVEYGYGLNYVDNTKIGVTGHSMGGGSTWASMAYFGRLYYTALKAAMDPASEGGEQITPTEYAYAKTFDKVAAGLPNSAASASTEAIFKVINANVGVLQGQYDEGGHSRPRGDSKYLPTDPEVLALVNSIMPEDGKLEEAELGKYYGDASAKKLRVFFNTPGTHTMQHFSKAAATNTVEFFEKALMHESGLAPTDHVWFVKALFNLLGYIGAFLFIIPFAVLVLRLPCFASLRQPTPKALPALKGTAGKLIFWGGLLLSGLVSYITLVPLGAISSGLFGSRSATALSSLFPATSVNIYIIWAIFNGLFSLGWFFAVYKLYGKKHGVVPAEMWGIRISFKELLLTVAAAAVIVAGFFSLVFAADYFFNTDFRFWILAIRSFGADKIGIAIPYMIMFLLFYVANSISINCANRREGEKEWLNLIVLGIANALGLLIAVAVQYITLYSTGTAKWGTAWLIVLFGIPLLIELFISTFVSRFLYKETGKVWLGAFVNCAFISLIAVTTSALVSGVIG